MTKDELLKVLKSWGIDTTKHEYELIAQKYERYEEGPTYKVTFVAPGDWVAYLSMYLHMDMTCDDVLDWVEDCMEGYDEDEFKEVFGSLKKMEEYALSYWWGDGDDYIISLTNLDTGKVLGGDGEDMTTYDVGDTW